jgi:hypothetical protein
MPPKQDTLAQAIARHRGGQRGNHNAVKHGFYAHQFNPTDLKDLEKCAKAFTGLADEIAMLRVQARRLVELSGQAQNVTEVAFTLRVLCLATLSINRLIRTQFTLGMQGNEVQDALSQALHDTGLYPGGSMDV